MSFLRKGRADGCQIAEPAAVFAFDTPDEEISEQRAAIEEIYERTLLSVHCVENVEVTFKRLLAAIYRRAVSGQFQVDRVT